MHGVKLFFKYLRGPVEHYATARSATIGLVRGVRREHLTRYVN